ncbi:MAG: TetR/AcrR family transcriptional regulator [Clostridia bacterium]|nr:TetR/AcrR family transcriptional regulator [Clostridia bacterium]
MKAEKGNLISDSISDEIVRIAEEIAIKDGAKNVNVSRIISEMGVTNRVFYNRFHNIGEVLERVYSRAVSEMKKSLNSEYDRKTQFFEYVMDISVKVLINTYDVKKEFSQYMFEFDSHSEENRIWWTNQIKKIIDEAVANGHIKSVDSDMLSYAIWCFFRGYNADAVNRNLSKEEAVRNFKFGLECLINGLKA